MDGGQKRTDGAPAPAGIVVGVTGHRDLADVPRVTAKIAAALDAIADPTSGPRAAAKRPAGSRLRLLSPLAEGADRLVAEMVLAREGAELDVVLPMGESEYERDFATGASIAEFRSLLARARAVHRLPGAPTREEAYAAAGRYIVDHSDVLLAVWNGRSAGGPGGTAEIVTYARSRSRRLVIVEP